MSRVTGRCPNCSAPIAFRFATAVQTTCAHCRSVVVRHDVDLAAIGEISAVPPDASPIQIGTRGRFEDQAFTVTGRIAYEYESGRWNEWHVEFADGTSGWLSDAQAEYAVSRLVGSPGRLPAENELSVGDEYDLQRVPLRVTTLTRAAYVGVEGELPFEYWGRDRVLFADLRGHDDAFATIDYSETPPLLFVGRLVAFDDLSLENLRSHDALAAGRTQGINCGNCGAAIELRALQHTKTVVCSSCAAVADPARPDVFVLQDAERRMRMTPTIPLGSRGTIRGHVYEVIGFQHRTIVVEGETYGWNEYVLFHPHQGFRYLSEYNGHWNDIKPLRSVPQMGGGRPASARYLGETFRHFQTAEAMTAFVLGEFPWVVRAGDLAVVSDYVHPPRLLSAEKTEAETTWSLGEYTTGERLWKAFDLAGEPPEPVGVFANQPSPYAGSPGRYWRAFGALAVLVLLAMLFRAATADREEVFSRAYVYAPAAGETSFVTDPFRIAEESSVEVAVDTNVQNSWTYFGFALIDAEAGRALDFGREVSYYSGRDSDGPWSEGSKRDSVVLSSVPAGTYYLRVEPEGPGPPVTYMLRVRRDVPKLAFYLVALLVLAVPPAIVTLRSAGFEGRRWAESDHAE